MVRKAMAAAAAFVLAVAPAQAACWKADEASAATVRELQSVLMVAALRCQVAHHEFTEDYNVFLRANKNTIQQMNDRLKAHFITTSGPVKGQAAYDAFTTSLANGHGAEGAGAELCGGMGALAREAALMAGSAEGLLLLAARQGLMVSLPEGACDRGDVTLALASPAAVVATAAAMPAAAAPVMASAEMARPVAVAAAIGQDAAPTTMMPAVATGFEGVGVPH